MPQNERLTKEKRSEAYEKFKDYLPTPGSGASLFDDWNEMAPDFLDQCSVPDRGDGDEGDEEDEGRG